MNDSFQQEREDHNTEEWEKALKGEDEDIEEEK